MLAFWFDCTRPQGDDAVKTLIGRAGVEQKRRMVMPVGYMGMAAADNIYAAAQALIKKAIIIIMSAELISVAD